MKLLLDENLPKRLKLDFTEHEIFTVCDKGWNGIKNGQLLKLLIENQFEALFTFDKNLSYQQNFAKYTITVFVLNDSNRQLKNSVEIVFKTEVQKTFSLITGRDPILLSCQTLHFLLSEQKLLKVIRHFRPSTKFS